MTTDLEPRQVLLDQARALGLAANKHWSTETLAEKVLEAQQNVALDARAAFDAAPKVPVLLKRDAFPLADEKHLAGETIMVPVDTAKAWIASGAAERADPLPGA